MNEDCKEFLALRLAQLREQKGVSARDMSLSLGQSESYINKIENERINPRVSILFNICEFLEISLSDFFDEGNHYPERLNGLIEDLKKLNSEELIHVSELVRIIVDKKK